YGCSMGGACLTRMLALGEMPIDRAIIDGGITPYQLLYPVRKLLLWRDIVSFKMAANSRKILEAAFPPERFTTAGHDPKKEYDAMEAYLKTFSDRTIRNIFWSANNYALPKCPAKTGTKLTYWYGDDEKRDRRRDIQFIKRYFPQARIHGIPKMAHAELVMVHPEKFCWYAEKFLTLQTEEA
ncbi:hydrolase, alpha/beta fold family protein, partial [human gut metagenome]